MREFNFSTEDKILRWLIRGYINTVNKILNDKININNVDLAISEYEDFCKSKNCDKFDINSHLNENSKIIYENY